MRCLQSLSLKPPPGRLIPASRPRLPPLYCSPAALPMATEEYLNKFVANGKRYHELPDRFRQTVSEDDWRRRWVLVLLPKPRAARRAPQTAHLPASFDLHPTPRALASPPLPSFPQGQGFLHRPRLQLGGQRGQHRLSGAGLLRGADEALPGPEAGGCGRGCSRRRGRERGMELAGGRLIDDAHGRLC